jgi:hypothetical protein
MGFDRKKMWWNSTWAYRLFRYHHIQLNRIFWSYTPVASDALKRAQAEVPTSEPTDLFNFHTRDAMRVPHPLSNWETAFKDSQTWVRSSFVLVIASILEVYIRTVVALALESDPGLLLKAPGLIDGVRLMKINPSYSYLEYGEACATGDWPKRVATYRSYFGSVPKDFSDSIKELEQLRKFRNGVGHTFGRLASEYKSRLDVRPKPLTPISEDRLKKWLAIAEKVVKAIDEDLGLKHIGAYECVYFYHSRIRNLRAVGHATPASTLKKELMSLHGHGPGVTFCKDLIRYYESV